MNITFLIGNGFDINLGLQTSYSDFVKEYKKSKSKNDNIKRFKENMKENQELWNDAEIALGQYTQSFGPGCAELFFECQLDFAQHLSAYLKKQTSNINYTLFKDKINAAFSKINKFQLYLPGKESDSINSVYQSNRLEYKYFNFINFNYTDTLKKCIDTIENPSEVLGSHVYANTYIHHKFGEYIHIHGTFNDDMIIGVNDDTQIANEDIFDCPNGDMYRNMLIKPYANEAYMLNNDIKALNIIRQSNIIFIYGMSLGETDKIWWQRICT